MKAIIFLVTLIIATTSAADTPYKIGAILALSGPQAAMGNYIKNGMEMALQSLPVGSMEIVYEDDQFQQTKAISAFHKLVNKDQVNAVVVLGSAMGLVVSPLAEQKKLPLIAVGASNGKVSAGKKFSFIHWIPPSSETALMIPEIKKRNYQRIAIIGSEQEGVNAVLDSFLADMKDAGLESKIKLTERVMISETDFRTFLAKAKSRNVDSIFALVFAGQLAPLSIQLKESGMTAEIFGVETPEDEAEIKAARGAMEGMWYATAANGAEWFQRSYNKRFGEAPGWAAANGHDTVMILFKATSKKGKDGQAVAQYLANLSFFSGALGTYSATEDHRFNLPAVLKVVKGHSSAVLKD